MTSADQTARDIVRACDRMRDLLLSKNKAYGDSAFAPVRVFSRADPDAGLRVRIDDKLSRIAQGHDHGGEDTLLDLIGYLILLLVARERAAVAASGGE